jgi:hypothetical protein
METDTERLVREAEEAGKKLLADLQQETDALRERLLPIGETLREAEVYHERGSTAGSMVFVLRALREYGAVLTGILDLMCDSPEKRAEKAANLPKVHHAPKGPRATCGALLVEWDKWSDTFEGVTCEACRARVKEIRAAAKMIPFTSYPRIPVVHVLREGLPVCAFSSRVPGEWPSGHQWVSEEHLSDVTCGVCKGVTQHYEIIGGHTNEVIGCTTGEHGKEDVLAEEPGATFRPITRADCASCKEARSK